MSPLQKNMQILENKGSLFVYRSSEEHDNFALLNFRASCLRRYFLKFRAQTSLFCLKKKDSQKVTHIKFSRI